MRRPTEPGDALRRPTSVGDREARFTALVDEVQHPLQRYLRRRTAEHEDVLADTLLVLWRRLDDVPADAVLPWAYGVAAGCLRNAERAGVRRTRLLRRVALEPVAPPPAEDPDLAAALAALRPDDQEVLRLWAWEQLAPREIAVVLQLTPGAVSTRLSRATARLREQLGKDRVAAGHQQGRQGKEVGS